GDPLFGSQEPPFSVCDEGEVVAPHVGGEAVVLRMPVALFLVDVDGTGERKLLDAVKRIEGEEQPPLDTHGEVPEAHPAGPVSGGDFSVHGMTVAGGLSRFSDLPGSRFADGEHAVIGHLDLRQPKHAFEQKGCARNYLTKATNCGRLSSWARPSTSGSPRCGA